MIIMEARYHIGVFPTEDYGALVYNIAVLSSSLFLQCVRRDDY